MADHPGYFGGSTVRDGKVRRLPALNWKELVNSGVNVPVTLPLNRKDFLAHPEKNKIKDGPWISPCAYDYEEEGKRGNAHATQSVLLFLDIDGGKYAGDLDRNPEALLMHLHPFNIACWRSASYTPSDPHLKLMVEIEPTDPSQIHRYVRLICLSLGIPVDFKGVIESSTISQPHYRPVKFKEEEFTAVIATRTNGRAIRESDLLEETEAELEDMLGERRYAARRIDDKDLGIAYVPLASVTLEDVKDALSAIDPDCDYKTWLTCCASMRHQFQDEESARLAFEAFDEWSSQGSKYRGHNETWFKWRSFNPYAEGRAPVTVKTLFKLAIEAGWNSTKVAVRHRGSVDEWMAQCEDADELMQEGPERIASLPFRNAVVEEDLVVTLIGRLKEVNGRRLEKRVIYREITRARRREKSEKQEKLVDDPPPWLRPFCYVSSLNQFHNFGNSTRFAVASFNNTYARELMPPDGAEAPPNGRPIVMPADFALNVAKIKVVDDVLYCPVRQGEDPFFTIDGITYLNLYNPLSVPVPTPERSEEAGALLTRLLDSMIAEPHYRDIFLDYLSISVKWPGRKVPWGTLIQSAEGAGKNYLGNIMSGVLGESNVRIIGAAEVCDKWNDFHTQGCVWAIINELHIPGERRERVSNAIKPLITDNVIAIQEKYRSVRNIPNYVNYVVFTNYPDALHLKPQDRRWFVIFSKLQTKEQIAELTATGIFEDLEPLLKELSGALRYWFLNRKISKDFPFNGPPPITKYRQMVIDDSTNPLQAAIESILSHDGDPMIQEDLVSSWHLANALPPELQKQKGRISHYLQLLGYERFRGRPYVNGTRSDVWVRPDKFITGIGDPVDVLTWRGEAAGDIIDV